MDECRKGQAATEREDKEGQGQDQKLAMLQRLKSEAELKQDDAVPGDAEDVEAMRLAQEAALEADEMAQEATRAAEEAHLKKLAMEKAEEKRKREEREEEGRRRAERDRVVIERFAEDEKVLSLNRLVKRWRRRLIKEREEREEEEREERIREAEREKARRIEEVSREALIRSLEIQVEERSASRSQTRSQTRSLSVSPSPEELQMSPGSLLGRNPEFNPELFHESSEDGWGATALTRLRGTWQSGVRPGSAPPLRDHGEPVRMELVDGVLVPVYGDVQWDEEEEAFDYRKHLPRPKSAGGLKKRKPSPPLRLLAHDTPWMSSGSSIRYSNFSQEENHMSPGGARVVEVRSPEIRHTSMLKLEGFVQEPTVTETQPGTAIPHYNFDQSYFRLDSPWGAKVAEVRESVEIPKTRKERKMKLWHTKGKNLPPPPQWKPAGHIERRPLHKKEKRIIKKVTANAEQHLTRLKKANEGKAMNWRRPERALIEEEKTYLHNPRQLELPFVLSPQELLGDGWRVDRGHTPEMIGMGNTDEYHARVDRPTQKFVHCYGKAFARGHMRARAPAKSTKPPVKSWRSIAKREKRDAREAAKLVAMRKAESEYEGPEKGEGDVGTIDMSSPEGRKKAALMRATQAAIKAAGGTVGGNKGSKLDKNAGGYAVNPLDMDTHEEMEVAVVGQMEATTGAKGSVFDEAFKEAEGQGSNGKGKAKDFEKPFGADAFLSSSSDEEDVPFRSGTYMGSIYNSKGRKKEDIYTRIKFELDDGANVGRVSGRAQDYIGNYEWQGEFNADDLTLSIGRHRENSALMFEGRKLEKAAFSGIWFPDKPGGEPGRFSMQRGKVRKNNKKGGLGAKAGLLKAAARAFG